MERTFPWALRTFLWSMLLASCARNWGLEPTTRTVEMDYIAWACECANWADSQALTLHNDPDAMAARCVYIEPADPTLSLPDTLGYSMDRIAFTGNYYQQPGFPDGYASDQSPEPARVFRYTAYAVIRSNHAEVRGLMRE